MPSIPSKEFPWQADPDKNRRDHVLSVAKIMMSAAHTAPITGGVDHLETELIWGEKELGQLAEKMDELSYLPENKQRGRNVPDRGPDGQGVRLCHCARQFSCQEYALRRQLRHVGRRGRMQLCLFPAQDGSWPDRPFRQELVQDLDRRPHVPDVCPQPGLWSRIGPVDSPNPSLVDARPFMTVGVAASKLGYCKNSAFV